jgi:hypothetical protein
LTVDGPPVAAREKQRGHERNGLPDQGASAQRVKWSPPGRAAKPRRAEAAAPASSSRAQSPWAQR